jgi:hypothetical protein
MSQENVVIVQAMSAAYFRGDEQAMLEHVDAGIVVTQFADQPDASPFHGHEGMLKAMAEWVETWDDYAIEILGMRDVEQDAHADS